ncbi:MAG: SIS domain-containing protein [Lachnospiraceae bacterium]|nr:SIS domain-containing protein [Lachnospiraceae bacterium]
MYTDYLKKLFCYLEETKVYDREKNPCRDYEEAIQRLVDLFSEMKENGKQVFFIGNGGSAAIASHMTADFMKNGGMKTYSLYDNSVTTCMGNDYGYEYIFSRPLEFLGNEGDLLVAVSSSGNSQNIVNAIQAAQKKRMKIITLSGFQKENRIIGMGMYNIHVPVSHYGMVESIHNLILQQIVDVIMDRDGECL